MSLRASLVMATLGRVAEIDRCVDSLAAQTRCDFELIIVDQNPDDRLVPVVDRARALGLACRHLRQQEPNLCLARNTGIECASGEIVAFPDDDCWYEPDVIEQALSRFEQQAELDGLVVRWCEAGDAAPQRISFDEFSRFAGPPASSITLFFRTVRLRAAGGFDRALGLHSWYGAGEETDLMLKLLREGAWMAFDPQIRVHHAMVASTNDSLRGTFERTRRRARGTGALYGRHPLPKWVVARGLLSPWLGLPFQLLNPSAFARKLGLGVGRFEGFVGWHLNYRLDGNN